jgi:hypothetical protein
MAQSKILKLSYHLRARFPFIVDILIKLPSEILFFGRRRRFDGRSMGEVFEDIHANNLWGHPESMSGFGSTLAATRHIRAELPGLLAGIGATSLLDIPCGDFNWIKATDLDLDHYIGGDLVEVLIAENRKKYASEKFRFERLDIASDPLPRVDLILCRDLFIHLPNSSVLDAIRNIKRSGSTYLLTTTFTKARKNKDVRLGSFRPLNLEKPPFSFPAPLEVIDEQYELTSLGRSLALWRIEDISVPDLPPDAA